MKVIAALAMVMLTSALVMCQTDVTEEPTTTLPTTTTTAEPTTTARTGVQPGGFCNGLLLPCDTYGNTVHCMRKQMNATIGAEVCEEGAGVDLGVCQCQRNCKTDGLYEDLAEFDTTRAKCVGLVGKACSILLPDCTLHATCNLAASVCACQNGYEPDASGLRCVAV